MSGVVDWVLPAVLVTLALVPVAYVLGRFIWSRIEPNDRDPGGRETPPRRGWTNDPQSPYTAVDLLRILRGGRR